jgi:hypothetical protein
MSADSRGRRGMDGGLTSPKTCQLVPPGKTRADWWANCAPCFDRRVIHSEHASTRDEAIQAHLEHIKAEHGA